MAWRLVHAIVNTTPTIRQALAVLLSTRSARAGVLSSFDRPGAASSSSASRVSMPATCRALSFGRMPASLIEARGCEHVATALWDHTRPSLGAGGDIEPEHRSGWSQGRGRRGPERADPRLHAGPRGPDTFASCRPRQPGARDQDAQRQTTRDPGPPTRD